MNGPKCYSYVRFSSPEQSKGDSLRRQLDLAREYAEKHNLVLDTELTLEDKGVSAFTGAHRKRGALGVFLELVRSGKIPKGSTLIVESLDRLSREQVLDAFSQFQSIINDDIKIVTLSDGMEYCRENINSDFTKLIISLTIMSRSYEESLQKSKRIRSAWEGKRKNLAVYKLTSMSPAWVDLSPDRKSFKLDESRAKIIREIFDKSVSGYGIAKIAKDLNEKGVESWGKSKRGWHSSYIHKVLRNRSVIGEFQPHTHKNQKRVPEGEPILGYFPKVIDEELYYQVQSRLTAGASYSGKTGVVSNLFGGLAKCGYCNAPMQFVNKGKKPKGGTYLVCDSARRGRGCDYILITYTEVELAILTLCNEIDLDLIFPDEKNENSKLTDRYARTIEAFEEKIAQSEKHLDTLVNNLSEDDDNAVVKRIKEKMVELDIDIEVWKKERLASINCRDELIYDKEMMKNRVSDIGTMYQEGSLQDIDVRIRLRSNLRSIFSKITVYPAGERIPEDVFKTLLEGELQAHRDVGYASDLDIVEITRYVKENTFYGINDKRRRAIRLDFKNGKIMMIRPFKDGKAGYHMDLEIDGKKVTMNFPHESQQKVKYLP